MPMTGRIYDPTQNSEIWRTTLIADRTTQTGSHSDPHLPVLKSLGNSPRAGARRRSPGLGGPVTMETYPDGGTWFQLCIVDEDVLAQVVAREKTTHFPASCRSCRGVRRWTEARPPPGNLRRGSVEQGETEDLVT